MSERTDWRVKATLDKDAIAADINRLLKILLHERVQCIVSAGSEQEALSLGEVHFNDRGVLRRHIRTLHARRMPI